MLMTLITFLSGWASPPPDRAAGDDDGLPPAVNENLLMFKPGEDPAAVLAQMQAIQARLRQENACQGTLLTCSERRRAYEECRSLERAIVWKYFERR